LEYSNCILDLLQLTTDRSILRIHPRRQIAADLCTLEVNEY